MLGIRGHGQDHGITHTKYKWTLEQISTNSPCRLNIKRVQPRGNQNSIQSPTSQYDVCWTRNEVHVHVGAGQAILNPDSKQLGSINSFALVHLMYRYGWPCFHGKPIWGRSANYPVTFSSSVTSNIIRPAGELTPHGCPNGRKEYMRDESITHEQAVSRLLLEKPRHSTPSSKIWKARLVRQSTIPKFATHT